MTYSFSTRTDRTAGENSIFIIGGHRSHFTATKLMACAVIAMHAGARTVSTCYSHFRINVWVLKLQPFFITCCIAKARAQNPLPFHCPKDFSKTEKKRRNQRCAPHNNKLFEFDRKLMWDSVENDLAPMIRKLENCSKASALAFHLCLHHI